MPKQNPASPNSVIGKVCAILSQFTLEQPVLSLDQIAHGSGVPRTSTYRILRNLIDEGYISLTPAGYKLGLRLFQIGVIAQQNFGFAEILDEVLEPLAQTADETVIAATLEQQEIIYLHVIQPSNPLRFVAGVGQRREATFGATGLALLSCLTAEERQAFVQTPLPQYTVKSVTDPQVWLERLERIAVERIVIEYSEFIDGIEAIAISIQADRPLVLSVVGPEDRMRPKEKTILRGLKEAAKHLEKISLTSF